VAGVAAQHTVQQVFPFESPLRFSGFFSNLKIILPYIIIISIIWYCYKSFFKRRAIHCGTGDALW
ncbi:MAG: hypothetical protein P8X86_16655, partial [Desulfofustis sp.]